MQHAVDQRRDREEETHDGPRGANVKQCAIGAHRRANQDKCAKSAGEVGEGNKKRIAGAKVMVAASEEMPQLVSEQNPKQRGGKRKSRQQAGRIFVEEREGPEKFVKRHGLVVSICDSKLSAGHEAGA